MSFPRLTAHLKLLAAAFLAAPGCVAEATDSPEEETESSELSAPKQLHSGRVQLLAAWKSKVVFLARTDTSMELRYASRTIGERLLASYPAAAEIRFSRSNNTGKVALVRREGNSDAVLVVDLAAAQPAVTEVVAPVQVQWMQIADDGTLAYTVPTSVWPRYDVFVRTPTGVLRAAGTSDNDPIMSTDGRTLAYRTAANPATLAAVSTETGGTAVADISSYGTFAFVRNRLLASFPAEGVLAEISPTAPRREILNGTRAESLDFRERPDGKVLVYPHSWHDRDDSHLGATLTIVDPLSGVAVDVGSNSGTTTAHVIDFRHVMSNDGHYLLDWYPSQPNGTEGAVWLHTIEPAGIRSTHLLDNVTVAGRESLGHRCAFFGRFVGCGNGSAGSPGQGIFSVDAPTSPLRSTAFGGVRVLDANGARIRSLVGGSVVCTDNTGTSADLNVHRAYSVEGDHYYRSSLLFDERDPATALPSLNLFDPARRIRTVLRRSTCMPAVAEPYSVRTTASRVFAADCAGLYAF